MSKVVIKPGTKLGMFEYQPDGSLHLLGKPAAQARNFRFIAYGGFVQLPFCLGMELIVHSPSCARSRSNTSGPGTPETLPSTSSR